MPDWSAGYVADIGYTYGTYPELNPQRIRLAFLVAGLVPPEAGTACELGFGQGMSVNVHAAASTTAWYGTDFNPAQAGFAQELAGASGARARLYDQSFEEFCCRDDLPDFDFIGLHGIFSWISDANRAIIVDFVRRKLKVGGVLYISYNTQAGWAAMLPVRDLLTEHASVMAAAGAGSLGRVDQSLAFMDKVFAADPRYAKANPNVKPRFDKIKEQDKAYLAHEYFNRDWLPLTFAQMKRWLEPAKLDFACSANYLDHIDAINLSPEQAALLATIGDATFQQTVRDFMLNQNFRRDYWVRGLRKLPVLRQDDELMASRVMLLEQRASVPLKALGAIGEVTLNADIYDPVLDCLADQQPHTIGAVVAEVAKRGVNKPMALQAIFMLAGPGRIALLQDDATIEQAKPQAHRLNLHLCALAMSSTSFRQLATPATGGSVNVGRFEMLFALARARGGKGPEAWAAFVHDTLARQGQRLMIDGAAATTDEQAIAELNRQATTFRDGVLPLLQRLGALP